MANLPHIFSTFLLLGLMFLGIPERVDGFIFVFNSDLGTTMSFASGAALVGAVVIGGVAFAQGFQLGSGTSIVTYPPHVDHSAHDLPPKILNPIHETIYHDPISNKYGSKVVEESIPSYDGVKEAYPPNDDYLVNPIHTKSYSAPTPRALYDDTAHGNDPLRNYSISIPIKNYLNDLPLEIQSYFKN